MARTKRKINHLLPAAAAESPKQRTYRTGGYVRLSVEDGGKHGADTIVVQQELILGYIAGQPDMEFVELYCDNGRTGTNFERPAFERLMEDVRTGKIDCIVVKDLSRFGRNYKETGNYLERIFPYLDVRFVAVNDNFDTLTAGRSEDGYIIPLKNIMNEVYSRDISRKVSSALATKRQRGEFTGSHAPYGYQKCAGDHNRLEPNAETAPVVKMIFQWRLSGISYVKIAQQLNRQGIPSPSRYHYLRGEKRSERYANAVWTKVTVKYILSHQVYLGHIVQGRKRNDLANGKKICIVPQEEWVIVRNTHEAIIDEETFFAVQKMAENCRALQKERLGKYDALGTIPNIFKGLIFCADCKRTMNRHKIVSKTQRYLTYAYLCQSHQENSDFCSRNRLDEPELKEIVWNLLQREIALAGSLEKLLRQYNQSAAAVSRESRLKHEIVSVQQILDRAEMLYDSLFQSYHDKLMTEQEYKEMRTHYQSEMEQAKRRLAELERQQQEQERQTTRNPWLIAYGQFQMETELTAEMVHTLIERVEIDGHHHVSVALRYQDEYRALVQLLQEAAVLA